MAHQTLPVLTHSQFPQVFAAAIDQLVTRAAVPTGLTLCCYESPESRWGACDSQPCRQIAVVHDVATELDYCGQHYREADRG